MHVAVNRRRQDVELLAPIGGVAVAEQTELLEDVERPIDGRRDRARIDLAAALDELGAGHVTVGPGEDLDEGPSLGRPTKPARPQTIPDTRPGGIGGGGG